MTRRGVTAPGTNAGSFAPGLKAESAVSLADEPDWRDTPVVVEGRRFSLGDVHGGRLFHGSPHPIDEGALLEPGKAAANFTESSDAEVSIASDASDALHWAREAAARQGAEDFYVYEVEPVGEVHVWRAMLANYGQGIRVQEARVPAARVLRRIDTDDARAYGSALARGENPLRRTEGEES